MFNKLIISFVLLLLLPEGFLHRESSMLSVTSTTLRRNTLHTNKAQQSKETVSAPQSREGESRETILAPQRREGVSARKTRVGVNE